MTGHMSAVVCCICLVKMYIAMDAVELGQRVRSVQYRDINSAIVNSFVPIILNPP